MRRFVIYASEVLLEEGINTVQAGTALIRDDIRELSKGDAAWRAEYKRDIGALHKHIGDSRRDGPYEQNASKISSLPLATHYFTGRKKVLDSLSEKLKGDITVISGLGGVGKTQLAIKYALEHEVPYTIRWRVRAEDESSMVSDLVELAVRLRLAGESEPVEIKLNRLRHWLSDHDDWLLIFDNAEKLDSLSRVFPLSSDVTGKVLITSRNANWGNSVSSIRLGVWSEDESVEFLTKRLAIAEGDTPALGRLARLLDNLPLALEQATAYISATGMNVLGYCELFAAKRQELWMEEAHPDDYPYTVATTWAISLSDIERESPVALALLEVCSFFAPDDIPLSLLEWGHEFFSEPFASALRDNLALNRALSIIKRYSLAVIDGDALNMHRLTQFVIQDRANEPTGILTSVLELQLAGYQFKPSIPDTWGSGALMTPHMLNTSELALNTEVDKMLATTVMHEAARFLAFVSEVEEGAAVETLFQEAEAVFRQVLTVREKAFTPNHESVAVVLGNLAYLLKRRAFKYQATLRLSDIERDKLSLEETIELVRTDKNKAIAESQRAISFFERAQEIDRQVFGKAHIKFALRTATLGSAIADFGTLTNDLQAVETGETLQRDALEIAELWEKDGRIGPEELVPYLNNLAKTYRISGKFRDAEALLRRSLDIYRKRLPQNSPNIATVLEQLGIVSLRLEDGLSNAVSIFDESCAIFRDIGMRDRFFQTSYYLHMALLLNGREHEAQECLSQVPEALRTQFQIDFMTATRTYDEARADLMEMMKQQGVYIGSDLLQ